MLDGSNSINDETMHKWIGTNDLRGGAVTHDCEMTSVCQTRARAFPQDNKSWRSLVIGGAEHQEPAILCVFLCAPGSAPRDDRTPRTPASRHSLMESAQFTENYYSRHPNSKDGPPSATYQQQYLVRVAFPGRHTVTVHQP